MITVLMLWFLLQGCGSCGVEGQESMTLADETFPEGWEERRLLDPTDPANDKERFVRECMMCHTPSEGGFDGMVVYLKENWYKGHGRMVQSMVGGPVAGIRFPSPEMMGRNQFLKYGGCNYEPYTMELTYHTDGGQDWECGFWGFKPYSSARHQFVPLMGRHDLKGIEAVTQFRRPNAQLFGGAEHRSTVDGPWQVRVSHSSADMLVIYTVDDVYYNLDIRGKGDGSWVDVPDGKEPKYASYCTCAPNQMNDPDWPGITDVE